MLQRFGIENFAHFESHRNKMHSDDAKEKVRQTCMNVTV